MSGSLQFSWVVGPDLPSWVDVHAREIYQSVWRFDFTAPGFALIDLGIGVPSRHLRATMWRLKSIFDTWGDDRDGSGFSVLSCGRFDQQLTTRFHLDSAPPRSLLMLGYEPSKVASRLSVADYSRCAHELKIDPVAYLDAFNPMFTSEEARLEPFITRLPGSEPDHSRILLINNSCLPATDDRRNPLGVLHKAEIPVPDPGQPRIVNSVMLGVGVPAAIDEAAILSFLATDAISRRA